MISAESWLATCKPRVEREIARHLPATETPPQRLHEAMRYAALNGGKRFRAALIYACGRALAASDDHLDQLAAAVELIHAYSLVHDDLPAMDDDALRRGQPTLHIVWDEAIAILAGDALQALAFEVLAKTHPQATPQAQLRAVVELATAIGSLGMAGGQALDLEAEGRALAIADLERVHRAKTGRLIQACVHASVDLTGGPEDLRAALGQYAHLLGLAYQVHDDVLDETGDTSTLGKSSGADLRRHKSTYPARLGVAGSTTLAQNLAQEALAALPPLPGPDDALRALAEWSVRRSS